MATIDGQEENVDENKELKMIVQNPESVCLRSEAEISVPLFLETVDGVRVDEMLDSFITDPGLINVVNGGLTPTIGPGARSPMNLGQESVLQVDPITIFRGPTITDAEPSQLKILKRGAVPLVSTNYNPISNSLSPPRKFSHSVTLQGISN